MLRFAQLKRELWRDEMLGAWEEVLAELAVQTPEIARVGSAVRLQPQTLTDPSRWKADASC